MSAEVFAPQILCSETHPSSFTMKQRHNTTGFSYTYGERRSDCTPINVKQWLEVWILYDFYGGDNVVTWLCYTGDEFFFEAGMRKETAT